MVLGGDKCRIRGSHISNRSGQVKQSIMLFILTIILSISITAAVDSQLTTIEILPNINSNISLNNTLQQSSQEPNNSFAIPVIDAQDPAENSIQNPKTNNSLNINPIFNNPNQADSHPNQTDINPDHQSDQTIDQDNNQDLIQAPSEIAPEQAEAIETNETVGSNESNATDENVQDFLVTPETLDTIQGFNQKDYSINKKNSQQNSYLLEISMHSSNAFSTTGQNPPVSVDLIDVKTNLSEAKSAVLTTVTSIPKNINLLTPIFAMQDIDVESATIRLPKDQNSIPTTLLHCENFDISNQTCASWEFSNIAFQDFGTYIEFTVDHFSAYTAGEILATKAEHYDTDQSYIQDIFTQIDTKGDNIWSPPIYANQTVRVTFETPLTNENTFDFVARSNDTIARIEIYEAQTNILVATSAVIDNAEHQYVKATGLIGQQDTFDFKIIPIEEDQEDLSICEANVYQECFEQSQTDPDSSEESSDFNLCLSQEYLTCKLRPTYLHNNLSQVFVEFDYIHDAAINSTDAAGMIVYSELNADTPKFRDWNLSNDFEFEQDAADVGGDQTWIVLRASHQRDELILGTIDKGNDINVQVYTNGTGWHDQSELTDTTENSAYRSLDIAYEDISGNALIVYEDDNTNGNNDLAYVIWNGSAYSSEVILDTTLTNSPFHWVTLVPRLNTNKIMLIAHNSGGDLYMIQWNGTDFDTATQATPSTGTTSNTKPHFDFAWETNTGEALLVYGEGNDLVYQTYDESSLLGAQNTIGMSQSIEAARLCSDPNSDYIGAIWQDSHNSEDVQARMWDGTGFLTGQPTEHSDTEAAGTNNANVDCAWVNSSTALFGLIEDAALSVSFFTWNSANTWSTSDLATTDNTGDFATDDIAGLRLVEHPTTNEVMLVVNDIAEVISTMLFNGTNMVNISTNAVESSTEVANAAQEAAMFTWFNFDPNPLVTKIYPSNQNFTINSSIEINASVTDNLNISQVFANITLPNGSLKQIELTLDPDNSTLYNGTFSDADVFGDYDLLIVANDTSTHQNYNSSETTRFTIPDNIFPSVDALLPAQSTNFNVSDKIDIATNLSDNAEIKVTVANITFPNGTIETITLSNSENQKYNASFIAPTDLGDYNVTFVINDTGSNINDTESTNFSVVDTINPNVTVLTPQNSSEFNYTNTIEISINTSDIVNISRAFVNITYPNSTLEQYELAIAGGFKYNTSFNASNNLGTYNLTFIVNDTSNNRNATQTTNFTVNDVVNPMLNITDPAESSSFFSADNVTISVNATDDINLSRVFANITAPNGTIQNLELFLDKGPKYNATTAKTGATGTYTILIIANDSSNNINSSETRTFSILDSNSSIVTLTLPTNASYQTSSTIIFNCNATDNIAMSNLSLYHNTNGTFQVNNTTSISGTNNETNFTVENIDDGTYLWNCESRDSADNNAFASQNFTVFVDSTSPNVTSLVPTVSSKFNLSQIIEINTTLQELFTVDTVTANVTFPNTTIETITLTDHDSDSTYNATFTVPGDVIGEYNITFIANDSAGNINNSETTNFSISDLVNPNVTLISCVPSLANRSDTLECNATITDLISLSTVTANITYPNGTVESISTGSEGSNYHVNITAAQTQYISEHTITWIATDSSSNINNTAQYFNITDPIFPSLTINSIENNSNSSNTIQSFNFTVTDNYDSQLNCSLYLNSTLNTTNSSTINNTATLLNATDFLEGNHLWFINCSDNSSNSNSSIPRIFTIDRSNVTFTSLNTNPKTTAEFDLDPNFNISVTANVSDNLTTVDTVIFQYKLSNDTYYTNLTMLLNDTLGYNTSFNASLNGTYNLQLWSNDSAGNSDISAEVNITVQLDGNWSTLPSASFTSVTANSSVNVNIGNLTINNTADIAINYTITSDQSTTVYNETENFSLAAGATRIIQVNETSPTGGLQTTTLTITAQLNDSENSSIVPSPSPSSTTVTGTVVVAPGQPVITSTFTIPSTETLSLNLGQENVAFVANFNNIGEGNASNVTYSIELPNDWDITFGDNSSFSSQLDSGDNDELSIELTIPNTEDAGTYYVYANVTAVNGSDSNLTTENLTFTDLITVTISENSTTELGSSGTSTGGGGGASPSSSSSSSTASTSGGSGGGGGGGSSKSSKVLVSEEIINIKQGQEKYIPITITNPKSNVILQNLVISVYGFLTEYISLNQSSIDLISEKSEETINLHVAVPSYVPVESYQFTVVVEGSEITTNNKGIEVKTSYYNQLNFLVNVEELTEEELAINLDEINSLIAEILQMQISTAPLDELLNLAKDAIDDEDFTLANKYLDQIKDQYQTAISAAMQIEKVEQLILNSKAKGIDSSQTINSIMLANSDLQTGDYASALEKAKNAELLYYLETKGEVNLLLFAKQWWWAISLVLIFLISTLIIIYHKLIVYIITQRLINLSKEEISLYALIRKAQMEYTVESKISEAQYDSYVTQYKKRLAKIKSIRSKLYHKQSSLLSNKSKLYSLISEQRYINSKLRQLQSKFFITAKIDQGSFKEDSNHYKERQSTIEHEIAVIRENHPKLFKKLKASSKQKTSLLSLKQKVAASNPKFKSNNHSNFQNKFSNKFKYLIICLTTAIIAFIITLITYIYLYPISQQPLLSPQVLLSYFLKRAEIFVIITKEMFSVIIDKLIMCQASIVAQFPKFQGIATEDKIALVLVTLLFLFVVVAAFKSKRKS